MLLWLLTAVSPLLPPEPSGMHLSIDLKIILQTAIAGLLVWSLSLVRDSRAKLAATVTKIAVIETDLKNMTKTLDRLEERANEKPL